MYPLDRHSAPASTNKSISRQITPNDSCNESTLRLHDRGVRTYELLIASEYSNKDESACFMILALTL
ncbi:CUGBP Elav-like family member 5 [Schistosoma japonicum]|nr:CUGBP Elav-like family member 5 [Schistosoma japonicum]